MDNKSSNCFERFDLDSKLAKKGFGFKAEVNLKAGMMLMKNEMFIPC